MFLRDKYDNAINVNQILSFFVGVNPDGGYQVIGNNAGNDAVAQFAVNTPMTEPEAETLKQRIENILGTVDLDD